MIRSGSSQPSNGSVTPADIEVDFGGTEPAHYLAEMDPEQTTVWISALQIQVEQTAGHVKVEPFMTGLVENNQYLGRPVDVLVMKDGSLLVSDDHNGAIYRISYGK